MSDGLDVFMQVFFTFCIKKRVSKFLCLCIQAFECREHELNFKITFKLFLTCHSEYRSFALYLSVVQQPIKKQ